MKKPHLRWAIGFALIAVGNAYWAFTSGFPYLNGAVAALCILGCALELQAWRMTNGR